MRTRFILFQRQLILDKSLEMPIKLDPSKNYKVAIKYFACYNLINNITSKNNEFHYKLNGSTSDWSTLRFVPGAYEIKEYKRSHSTSCI